MAESKRLKLMASRIDDLVRDFEQDGIAVHATNGHGPATPRAPERPPGDPASDKLDAAYVVLQTEGRPIPRKDLVAKIEARGISIPNADTFGQAMSRDQRFQGVGRGRAAMWQTAPSS